MTTNTIGVIEVSEKDLTEEEKENLANGEDILSCKEIPFSELLYNDIPIMYGYHGRDSNTTIH